LSKLDTFTWDRLYIFGPYTSPSSIQERLGKNWSPDRPFDLSLDIFVLLVFTDNGEIVQHVMYPRGPDDFYKAS